MLTLEIEWLGGVAYLARTPSSPVADWPPEPDRVFSALVASWAARGQDAQERAALEWLEAQPAPTIAAVRGTPRRHGTAFVPVNDKPTLPERRPRQPRQFPSVRLGEGPVHLRLRWPKAPDPSLLDRLAALAHDTSYLGHSASLVRCRFAAHEMPADGLVEAPARRAPWPGRLQELQALHRRHLAGDERARPRPAPVVLWAEAERRLPSTCFSPTWTVLAHAGGDRPDLRATAVLGRRLRAALMSAWPDPVPDWLSGHGPDAAPTREPHMAVVPLADVGHRWSQGRLMELGIVLPRAVMARWDPSTPAGWQERRRFIAAVETLCSARPSPEHDARLKNAEPFLRLALGPAGVWHLAPEASPSAASLDPARHAGPSRRFATVTPIALDRHPKGDRVAREAEAAAIVAECCRRIGLPDPIGVLIHKHPGPRGVPSARPASGTRVPAGWVLPGPLAGRILTHATITFKEEVAGPLILGAGRFVGLGLCLPLQEEAP